MAYTWGYDEFVKEVRKLNELIEKESDIKRKVYLQKIADTTDKLFHDNFNNFQASKVTARQRLSSILNARLSYGRYYSIIGNFLDTCVEHLELADNISTQLEEIDENGKFYFLHTGASNNHSKTLSLVDKFYSTFDRDLYQVFSSIYEERQHNIKFLSRSQNDDKKSNGNTLFIGGVNKNFISICDISPLENYGCAVHEYGHAIHNIVNPDVSYADREDFFIEVAAIFPELVALYENKGNFDDLEVAYNLYTNVVTYLDLAEFLNLHTPIVNAWADNKFVMSNRFFSELEESYEVDEECFEKALSTTIEDDGVYVLSFIVSLELLHMYKNDKKKALELFKNFLTYPANEDLLVFMLKNLSLNSHAKEEVGIILNNFNKKLQKRRF